MKIRVAAFALLASVAPALADPSLTVTKVDPTTVGLAWTTGSPYYQVYRAPAPSPAATLLSTAPLNTAYRGLALSPH